MSYAFADPPKYPEIEVELSDIDGSAPEIIGAVRRAMRRHGVPNADISAFTAEATSADYDNVLQTCMRWVEVS